MKPIARARARENHARAPTRWRFAVIAVRLRQNTYYNTLVLIYYTYIYIARQIRSALQTQPNK